jgi:hypothetical protein
MRGMALEAAASTMTITMKNLRPLRTTLLHQGMQNALLDYKDKWAKSAGRLEDG